MQSQGHEKETKQRESAVGSVSSRDGDDIIVESPNVQPRLQPKKECKMEKAEERKIEK